MSDAVFRAITTQYKGYNFRSRLEARWAVFFDHLNIRWEYEPEGYELGNGLRYLPDFWLPDWKMWVEIKPGPPDDAAREKAWRLAEHSGRFVFMSDGMPDNFGTVFSTFQGDWLHRYAFRATPGWHSTNRRVLIQDQSALDELAEWTYLILDQMNDGPKLIPAPLKPAKAPLSGISCEALEVARGARFEFGAKGAIA